ncbi:hypothetical protein BYZ73_08020 [Rhodovulum viride]|uniref:Secreted protein n=1 Tax=Rhodovulum viride TaxID=1231134 RepID=A0ABX9DHP2_9RHOB|nr:hypothetical protein [Rhodovulum viride]RAP41889.1 hypothetical protein BYZ73_08020 [Rhodovulum viride]
MKGIFSLAGLALAAGLGTAQASTLTLDYTGQTPGAKTVYYSFYGRSDSASAGQFAFDVAGQSDPLLAWCVDLTHALSQTATGYTTGASLFGSTVLTNLDRLFTQHYADVVDAVSSAAFQVAIWEVVYDSDSLNLGRGAFRLSGWTDNRVERKAADFLALTDETGGYQLDFLKSTSWWRPSQSLVTAVATPDPAPVPLPAPVLMLGSGLLALLGLSRRRKAA